MVEQKSLEEIYLRKSGPTSTSWIDRNKCPTRNFCLCISRVLLFLFLDCGRRQEDQFNREERVKRKNAPPLQSKNDLTQRDSKQRGNYQNLTSFDSCCWLKLERNVCVLNLLKSLRWQRGHSPYSKKHSYPPESVRFHPTLIKL
jgi:hypothetical protein